MGFQISNTFSYLKCQLRFLEAYQSVMLWWNHNPGSSLGGRLNSPYLS